MVFHTIGAGGQTLDQIVRERPVAAVVDMSLVEINNHLNSGLCSAGPDRSKAALERGVPVVFAPGNVDFIIAGPIDEAKRHFPGKRYHLHNAALTAVRTEMPELCMLADHLAEIMTSAKGPIEMLLPLKGFSNHDSADGYLHDPALPPLFAKYLEDTLPKNVRFRSLDYHINDPEFADALVNQVMSHTRSL
jgi:uncharacterized protein (UPF0261 family)